MIAFLSVLTLTVLPFYVLGGSDLPLEGLVAIGLPPSAFMFLCPTVAALALTSGRAGAVLWATSALRLPLHGRRIWLVGAVATMPAVLLVASLLRPAGPGSFGAVSLSGTGLLAVTFLVTGLAEQLGWTGYARPRLRQRWSWPRCAIVIGLCWAAIHVIPWAQTGHDASWVAGQSLFTVGLRLVMDFFVERLGSDVLTAAVCQASSNVAWMTTLDATGAYDPWLTGGLVSVVALLLVGIAGGGRAGLGRASGGPSS